MVKKALAGGEDCRKCEEATEFLKARGLWDRVDEIVWAIEDDPDSPGMELGRRHGVERAPFFIVRDGQGEPAIYTSVLQLIRERLGTTVSATEQAQAIDVDDIGGI
jgi:hypothetical protein